MLSMRTDYINHLSMCSIQELGFEPRTFCSQSRRANQTALYLDRTHNKRSFPVSASVTRWDSHVRAISLHPTFLLELVCERSQIISDIFLDTNDLCFAALIAYFDLTISSLLFRSIMAYLAVTIVALGFKAFPQLEEVRT